MRDDTLGYEKRQSNRDGVLVVHGALLGQRATILLLALLATACRDQSFFAPPNVITFSRGLFLRQSTLATDVHWQCPELRVVFVFASIREPSLILFVTFPLSGLSLGAYTVKLFALPPVHDVVEQISRANPSKIEDRPDTGHGGQVDHQILFYHNG